MDLDRFDSVDVVVTSQPNIDFVMTVGLGVGDECSNKSEVRKNVHLLFERNCESFDFYYNFNFICRGLFK